MCVKFCGVVCNVLDVIQFFVASKPFVVMPLHSEIFFVGAIVGLVFFASFRWNRCLLNISSLKRQYLFSICDE